MERRLSLCPCPAFLHVAPAAGVDRSLQTKPEVWGVEMGARGRGEEPNVQVSLVLSQEGKEKEEAEEAPSPWEPDREKFLSLMLPACHQPCGHPRSQGHNLYSAPEL